MAAFKLLFGETFKYLNAIPWMISQLSFISSAHNGSVDAFPFVVLRGI